MRARQQDAVVLQAAPLSVLARVPALEPNHQLQQTVT